MPYTKIFWIKLEKRLLNDYRFFTMSEPAQLIYVKLLMISAETDNKIPKNDIVLKKLCHCSDPLVDINSCLEEIKLNFPKFVSNKHFYYFKDWAKRHNTVIPGKSDGNPRVSQKDLQSIVEYIIEKNRIELDKDGVSVFYKRHCRAAKDLLLLCNQNVEKAKREIDRIGNYMHYKKLSWTLETICKWFGKDTDSTLPTVDDKIKELDRL